MRIFRVYKFTIKGLIILKSDNNVRDSLLKLREEAVQAQHKIAGVIAAVDDMLCASNTQNMIVHYYNNGCTYAEIADKVGLSYTAVYNRCCKLKSKGIIK